MGHVWQMNISDDDSSSPPSPVYQVVVQGAEHMPHLSELCTTT